MGSASSKSLVLCVLALSMTVPSVSRPEILEIAATARDPGIAQWISLEILGPRNHPFPIVYISTQRFATIRGESLIVLAGKRYAAVAAYTRKRLSLHDCLDEASIGDRWYSVKISAHSASGTETCVLPQSSACPFLEGVAAGSREHLAAEELLPVRDFMDEVRCK